MNAGSTHRIPLHDNRIVEKLIETRLSLSEAELLEGDTWSFGEDSRARSNYRLRQTPWGRWILIDHFLANELIVNRLRQNAKAEDFLEHLCLQHDEIVGRHCVLCVGDPRLLVIHGTVRLSASELSLEPLVEEATSLEQFVTHLPLFSLQAAAASAPDGDWGAVAKEQHTDALGWMRVTIHGRKLNDRMFVAQISGHSMDDGKSGLKNEAFAVFEFWPAGTRQNKIVLVRGAFTDPDTGSYAVKKYVADQRGSHNTHRRIVLVSLNPDKERYPDIVLQPEQDDDLTVVAALVSPLAAEDFKRRPKSVSKTGKRDLVSDAGRSRVKDRLQQAARRVFGQENLQEESAGAEFEQQACARFVCYDSSGGGLHIETRPMPKLPTFAKKLRVATGSQSQVVLASNFRNLVCRTQVPASTVDYEWSAPGFEAELSDELIELKLEGLACDVATLFRVDSAGMGQLVTSGTLTLGQSYRVLIPPALSSIPIPLSQSSMLNDSWRLWECDVPVSLPSVLRNTLEQLGLQTGKTAPTVCWVVHPPVKYSQSTFGEVYPSFDSGATPTLRISGLTTHVDGELYVFLLANDKMLCKELPAGDSWLLQLGKLPVGRYVIEVTHRRTRVESVRMPFEVIAVESILPVDARLVVTVDGVKLESQADGLFLSEHDLTILGGAGLAIHIQGPPLWPCHQSWIAETKSHFGTTCLTESGELNLEELDSCSLEYRERSRIGNLLLDFEELGQVELHHTRRTDPDQLRADITKLTKEKATAIEAMSGQFPLLRTMWIHPLLEQLGYQLREVDSSVLEHAPAGATAILLYEYTRSDSRVRCNLKAPLLITHGNSDWGSFGGASIHAFAERLCKHFNTGEAFITDGLRWTRHRKGRRIHSQIWDLRTLASQNDGAQFENFLFDFAPEV